jgi:hypothetical protein
MRGPPTSVSPLLCMHEMTVTVAQKGSRQTFTD